MSDSFVHQPLRNTPGTALYAALNAAALAPLDSTAWLGISGEDRVRWLNGMTTNSVQALKPGEGCYTFFLNAQGKIQGDATLWMGDEQVLLLETAAAQLPKLCEFLERFIIMDDVEIQPLASEQAGLLVVGPDAETRLSELLTLPAAGGFRWQERDGLRILRVPGVSAAEAPRFEVWGAPSSVDELKARLRLPLLERTEVDALRILSGTPLFGVDIRERELPQETAPAGAASRALHFSKGCYLGQEIVERIHSRGNVHRVFSGFVVAGELPPAGKTLATADAPDKALGELTSVTQIAGQTLALGYVRREALERKLPLTYAGGTAEPVTLPFSLPPQ